MRIIFAFLLSIAAAAGLYSFQDRGAIRGHVLQSKTGEPVKKAVVVLKRAQEPGTGASTDASGAFRFDDLEPGAYTLSTERTGFILDPESDRSVTVKPGHADSEVTLKLIRTGAISGRVLDGDGETITGASVQVVPVNQKKAGVVSSFSAVTDDRGEYRSFNIPPGRYRIVVSYDPPFQLRQVKMQHARTPQGGAAEETYTLTYYPAALDPKQAQTIDVQGGADLRGFDVQILRARGVTVRGTVSRAGGAPAGAVVFVGMNPVGRTIGFRGYDNMIQDPGGAFELTQVLPGTYSLGANAPLGDQSLSARRVIEVGNTDLDGIQLTLAPPQTISGSIILPEGRKIPAGLIAVLVSRESRDNRGGGMTQPGTDGGFQIREVPPGDYDLAFANTGPGDDLYVSAILAGDDDALAGGVHVGGQAAGALKVILKGNGGTVQVSVKDAKGKALPDAYVRLVPDAPRRGQMALYADCKTDASGSCSMLGVAPGSYHAFAFGEERQVDFRDAAAVGDIEDYGKAVSIAESGQQGVELTPVPEDK